MSNVDQLLRRGTTIGSVHSVSSVTPLLKFGGIVDRKKENVNCSSGEATKNESVEGSSRETTAKNDGVECSSVEVADQQNKPVQWDLSHLDHNRRVILEKVLHEERDVFQPVTVTLGISLISKCR